MAIKLDKRSLKASEDIRKKNRRLRHISSLAMFSTGLLLLSTPLWLFVDPALVFWGVVTAGGGAVLIAESLASIVNDFLDPTKDALSEVFDEEKVDDNPHNLRGIIAAEINEAANKIAKGPISFGSREKLINELTISDAKEELLICFISLSRIYPITRALKVIFKANDNFKVRVLLLNPYSMYVEARAKDLQMEKNYLVDKIKESAKQFSKLKEDLESIKEGLGNNIEVKGYDNLPSYGLICKDKEKMVLTLYRENRPGDENLAILISESPATYEFFGEILSTFEERSKNGINLVSYINPHHEDPVVKNSDGLCTVSLIIHFGIHIDKGLLKIDASHEYNEQINENENESVLMIEVLGVKPGSSCKIKIEKAISINGSGWLPEPYEINSLITPV